MDGLNKSSFFSKGLEILTYTTNLAPRCAIGLISCNLFQFISFIPKEKQNRSLIYLIIITFFDSDYDVSLSDNKDWSIFLTEQGGGR